MLYKQEASELQPFRTGINSFFASTDPIPDLAARVETRTTERNRKSVCLIVNVSCKTRATQSNSHADDILCVGFHGDLLCPLLLFPTSPHGSDPYD